MKAPFGRLVPSFNFLIMKRLFVAISIAFALSSLVLSSCSSKNESNEPIYSSADTIQVETMIKTYLTDLQNKDYEGAVSQLKVLYGNTVKELTEDQHKELVAYYTQMPVLAYKLKSMRWNCRDLINYVYDIEFFEKNPEIAIPNTYKITLVPVRINGQWYLTLEGLE